MREARAIMAELAASGLSAEQQALLFELTAAVATEARPAVDQAAEKKRSYDREYRRAERNRKSRTTSYDKTTPPPKEYISNPPPETPSPKGDAPLSVQAIFDFYNETAKRCGLRKAEKLTTERRKRIKARQADHGDSDFRRAIENAGASAFCRGQNDRNWRADLDFVLQPESFVRLLEGFYGDTSEEPVRKLEGDELRTAQLNAADLYDRMGRGEEAAALRRKWATVPPGQSIGAVVRSIVPQRATG